MLPSAALYGCEAWTNALVPGREARTARVNSVPELAQSERSPSKVDGSALWPMPQQCGLRLRRLPPAVAVFGPVLESGRRMRKWTPVPFQSQQAAWRGANSTPQRFRSSREVRLACQAGPEPYTWCRRPCCGVGLANVDECPFGRLTRSRPQLSPPTARLPRSSRQRPLRGFRRGQSRLRIWRGCPIPALPLLLPRAESEDAPPQRLRRYLSVLAALILVPQEIRTPDPQIRSLMATATAL